MTRTDFPTAMLKLKKGHIVVSIIDEKRFPLCPFQRRYEYYPKRDYVITKGHIMNADWFYKEVK